MRFSKRTGWANTQNRLAKKIAAKSAEGAPLVDLTQSNPTQCNFRFLGRDRLSHFLDSGNLCYEPDPHGLLQARTAICQYYAKKNITLKPDQIFLTAGTSEAYGFLFRLLADPGDLVLTPRPGYPLFDHLCDLSDVRLSHYGLVYDGAKGWSLSPELYHNARVEKPRMVIAINPNNPTGNFITENELRILNALCHDNECTIISDEVFLDFGYEKTTQPVSLAANNKTMTFTLSGVSKILGLPQMKLGWIVVSGPSAEQREAIGRLEIIADAHLSVNTPAQRALAGWLEGRVAVQNEMLERILENRSHLKKKFPKGSAVEILESAGGWYAVLRIESVAPGTTDEEMALRLIEKQNLVVYPGYFFDFDGENFLVISLILPSPLFCEGIDRLAAGVL